MGAGTLTISEQKRKWALIPNYEGMSFDPDHHQGRGGWTSGQILNSLESAFLEDWYA